MISRTAIVASMRSDNAYGAIANGGMVSARAAIDVAHRHLVLNENEKTRDNVLDKRLAAEPDSDPNNPCAGQEWGDANANLRQNGQPRDRDNDAEQRGA